MEIQISHCCGLRAGVHCYKALPGSAVTPGDRYHVAKMIR